MNVFLIGYRGSGKTTVARALAERLAWPWADADEQIEARAGKSIREIFADDGEGAFRDWESKIVMELAGRDRHVIALGGGAILRAENRAVLAGRGKIVWLQASAEALAERIAQDPSTAARRPSLTGQGTVAEIRSLLAERAPIYAASADVAIETESKSPQSIASEILTKLSLQEST